MGAQYFLGSTLLGSGKARHYWDKRGEVLTNIIYICPTCGNPWGRVINFLEGTWMPEMLGCSSHPSFWADVGGSFLGDHQPQNLLKELSSEVLTYEFNLRLPNLFKD